MASVVDRFFGVFEGERHPLPVAIFRIVFFSGLALHFFPSLLHLEDGYQPDSMRTDEWNHWLYQVFPSVPQPALKVGAFVTIAATLMTIAGARTRLAATVAATGCFVFASFNGLHVQTLALIVAWSILPLWTLCGGGGAALSIDALAPGAQGRREPKLLPALVLYQVLLAVFFAGVEKLLVGWPQNNEMQVLLAYPKGFLVRDWVTAVPILRSTWATSAFSWFTIVVELGAPILLMFRRTRLAALVAYEAFFLGIIAMLEVPPLFYCTFAAGALLALDDEQVESLMARAKSLLDRRLSDTPKV